MFFVENQRPQRCWWVELGSGSVGCLRDEIMYVFGEEARDKMGECVTRSVLG